MYLFLERNNKFIVFVLTWPGLEPTIYRIHGERSNYHTTDALDIYIYEDKNEHE